MGSSKSRAPSSTTIIQQTPVSTAVDTSTSATTSTETEKASDVLSSEARSENILRRGRGRFGTILTGFQGVLTKNDSQSKRKTLLGE